MKVAGCEEKFPWLWVYSANISLLFEETTDPNSVIDLIIFCIINVCSSKLNIIKYRCFYSRGLFDVAPFISQYFHQVGLFCPSSPFSTEYLQQCWSRILVRWPINFTPEPRVPIPHMRFQLNILSSYNFVFKILIIVFNHISHYFLKWIFYM